MNKRDEQIITQLQNKGVVRLNEQQDEFVANSTIIVLGVARSGTSMIAGVLNELQVPMGMKHEQITFEDLNLSRALEEKNYSLLKNIIQQYNEQYSVWAWKRPALLHTINRVEKYLRNPRYIIVFRDVLSIANRNAISMHVDVLKNMSAVLKEYQKLHKFLHKQKNPCLLVSYEAGLKNKEHLVEQVANFVGENSESLRHKAISSINPLRPEYLNSTRIDRTIGRLVDVSSQSMSGWVAYVLHKDKIPLLELLINDQLVPVDDYVCHLSPRDLDTDNIQRYDFSIELSRCEISAGDEVRVKVADDLIDLDNSPTVLG